MMTHISLQLKETEIEHSTNQQKWQVTELQQNSFSRTLLERILRYNKFHRIPDKIFNKSLHNFKVIMNSDIAK